MMPGLLHICIVIVAVTREFVPAQEQDGDLRLVGGTSESAGRVEVIYSNTWGTVCDSGWDDTDAGVVCRQLGLGDVGTALPNAFFGAGSGPIWFSGIACGGNESRLEECSNGGGGMGICDHGDDASVRCDPPVDTTPPVIFNCPDSISRLVELGEPGIAAFWIDPTATDNSGTARLLSRSHGPGEFPVGATGVTYTFVDASDNRAICQFDVIIGIVDTTPPVISNCPDSISRVVEAGVPGISAFWIDPTATDISGTAHLLSRSHGSGETFPVGVTGVTYTFADGSDNRATCQFNVFINTLDTAPPVIFNCPNSIMRTIELGTPGSIVTWSEPSAMDTSGTARLLSRSHDPGEFFPVGVTGVTYIFVDASDNPAPCQFNVIIGTVDSTRPTCVNVPQGVVVTVEPGTAGTAVSWTEPSCDDLSGAANVTMRSHMPSTLFEVGVTMVTYTCTDVSGNSEMCQFNVTVNERLTTCTGFCPDSTTVITCNDEESVSWDTPMSFSDRMSFVVESSHSPGDVFQLGTTVVSYSVKEAQSGEAEVCNFHITVKEANNCPFIKCIYIAIAVLVIILLIVLFLLVILKIRHGKKAKPSADGKPAGDQVIQMQSVNDAYEGVTDNQATEMP